MAYQVVKHAHLLRSTNPASPAQKRNRRSTFRAVCRAVSPEPHRERRPRARLPSTIIAARQSAASPSFWWAVACPTPSVHCLVSFDVSIIFRESTFFSTRVPNELHHGADGRRLGCARNLHPHRPQSLRQRLQPVTGEDRQDACAVKIACERVGLGIAGQCAERRERGGKKRGELIRAAGTPRCERRSQSPATAPTEGNAHSTPGEW